MSKHQWVTFRKGRMRVKACSICGDLQLPSNAEQQCTHNEVFNSQLIKSGYRFQSESRYNSQVS
ncbi:MAG: hypothetical protein KUG78_13300 [Kangiellaceae bacterium]|nr:hypothetical protein [Kangiellaceae bacterium]